MRLELLRLYFSYIDCYECLYEDSLIKETHI